MFMLADVACGNDNAIVVDEVLPSTIALVVTILKIAIPIIIVIFGILDLAKAVMANEEKEMKTAQKTLIKRIVYGVVIFFVFTLVQFVFSKLDSNNSGEYSCMNCFINGTKHCNYK